MNVAFDILLKEPELVPFVSKKTDLDAFFGELCDFVRQRLKSLEEVINAEEAARPDENLVTIIVLEPPKQMTGMRLFFQGYSDDLAIRMKGCFSKSEL